MHICNFYTKPGGTGILTDKMLNSVYTCIYVDVAKNFTSELRALSCENTFDILRKLFFIGGGFVHKFYHCT